MASWWSSLSRPARTSPISRAIESRAIHPLAVDAHAVAHQPGVRDRDVLPDAAHQDHPPIRPHGEQGGAYLARRRCGWQQVEHAIDRRRCRLRMALRSRSSSTTMRTGRTRSPKRRLRSSRACWFGPVAITVLAPIASATATPPLPKAPVAPFTRTVSPAAGWPRRNRHTARRSCRTRTIDGLGIAERPDAARRTPSARGYARPTSRRGNTSAGAWPARCLRSGPAG